MEIHQAAEETLSGDTSVSGAVEERAANAVRGLVTCGCRPRNLTVMAGEEEKRMGVGTILTDSWVEL